MFMRIVFKYGMSLAVLAVLLAATGKGKAATKPVAGKKAFPQEVVARGSYLVTIAGCNDCHTPHIFDSKTRSMVPDSARLLSGHPEGATGPMTEPAPGESAVSGDHTSFRGGWGFSYAANLTPDKTTGLGQWTETDFVLAMRTGRKGDHFIQPPMPWYN
ncbi:MAG: hypothetical protein ACREDU_07845, partial [Methylocella sp.]